jgi:hypothetical protein
LYIQHICTDRRRRSEKIKAASSLHSLRPTANNNGIFVVWHGESESDSSFSSRTFNSKIRKRLV